MSESSASGDFHASPGDASAHQQAESAVSRQGHGPAFLVRLGGGLGLAGSFLGLLIFLVACHGFDGVFPFSLLPFTLGLVGLLLALIGALQAHSSAIEDTHVLASVFVNVLAIAGGLIELATWLKWPIFPASGV